MPNGDSGGGGGGIGSIFDPIVGLLAAAINAIIAFLRELVRVLAAVLNFLWAGELSLGRFSLLGDTAILKWFRHVFSSIFQAGMVNAIRHLLSLYQKLRAWLQKLKAWLDRLHALQQKYMVTALRRVINIIQRVRKVLVIFRLLHFKFAAKLDNWLAGIEGRIVSALFTVARKTNTLIAWLNWLFDPLGMIRRNVLVRSLAGALDDLAIALTGRSWGALLKIGKPAAGPPLKTTPISRTMDLGAKQLLDGTGDAGDIYSRAPKITAQLFAEMGVEDVPLG